MIYDKIIRALLILLIITIPLYFDLRLYATFDLAKLTLLYLLILPMLGCWAIKWIVTKQCYFVRTPLDLPIFAFWGINILCTLISWSPCISLFGFYKRYEGLLAITAYICLYYIVVNFTDKVFIKRMIKTAVFIGMFEGIYGVIQHLGYDPFSWSFFDPYRIFGTFGSAPFLSTYLIMVFFFALALYIEKIEVNNPPVTISPTYSSRGHKKKTKKKAKSKQQNEYITYPNSSSSTVFQRLKPWYYGICIILILVGFFYTNTRATTLGIFFGLILFIIATDKHRIAEEKQKLIVLLGCLLPITIYFLANPNTSVIKRFINIAETEPVVITSIEEIDGVKVEESKLNIDAFGSNRIRLWKRTLGVIKEHPILGIGLDTLQLARIGTDKAHNDFLDITVTRGLIGLVIYLWLLITLGRWFLRTYHKLTGDTRVLFASIGACELGYLVQNQFNFGLVCIMSLFWISAGMLIVVGTNRKNLSTEDILHENKSKIQSPGIRYTICTMICICVVTLMWLSTIPYRADIWYRKGFDLIEDKRYAEAIPYLEKAVEIFPYETCYWKVLNSIYVERANNDKENRDMWIKKAIHGSKFLLKFIPRDEGSYFNLGMVYTMLGMYEEAEAAYKKTISIAKNYVNAYNNLGTLYANQKRWDEAIRMFEKTLEMRPQHSSALANLKRVYRIQGNLEKVFEVDEKYGKGIERHISMAEKYYRKGMIQETIKEFKEILKKDPEHIDTHRNLGSLYYQQGMFKEAKKEFQKVLELNPDDEYVKRLLKTIE